MRVLPLFPLLLAIGPDWGAAAADPPSPVQWTVHQQVIVRFRRLPDSPDVEAAVPAPPKFREHKGPRCVPIPLIDAAQVSSRDSIDLMMIDGGVLRTRFADRCPALVFYPGLYMRQTADGLVCAGRDALRARSGGECRIKGFKRLERKK
ncbi:MAG: hypothetical protein ACRCSO_12700 [Sphingomonas sp.]